MWYNTLNTGGESMIQVDIRSRVPIYEQLYENIRRLILEDIIQEDEQLPSIRELASHLTVNPNTIQKAFKQLEQDGYIYSVKGRGNFAKKLEKQLKIQEIEGVIEKLQTVAKEAILLDMKKETLIECIHKAYEGGQP